MTYENAKNNKKPGLKLLSISYFVGKTTDGVGVNKSWREILLRVNENCKNDGKRVKNVCDSV